MRRGAIIRVKKAKCGFFYKIDNPKEFSLLIQDTFECSKEGIYPHIKANLGVKFACLACELSQHWLN